MGKNEIIQSVLEAQGLDQEQVAEIMYEISQVDLGDIDPTLPVDSSNVGRLEMELKNRLDNESDWKKRAVLAARIISLGLDS